MKELGTVCGAAVLWLGTDLVRHAGSLPSLNKILHKQQELGAFTFKQM